MPKVLILKFPDMLGVEHNLRKDPFQIKGVFDLKSAKAPSFAFELTWVDEIKVVSSDTHAKWTSFYLLFWVSWLY